MSERTQRAQRAARRAQALAMNAQSHDFPEAQIEAPHAPQTFRERHALKVMGAIGAVMFSLVIIAQVGC